MTGGCGDGAEYRGDNAGGGADMRVESVGGGAEYRGDSALSSEAIRSGLLPEYKQTVIIVERIAASTNDTAKSLAQRGAAHGTTVVAEGQTAGRGRYARSFHSPAGAGLYMSAALRPRLAAAETPLITIMAALSVCGAVRALTGLSPRIKWVNDILLDGKKFCGILTEAAFGAQGGGAASVVTGIGVNVSVRAEDFPAGLRGAATSLYPDGRARVSRNALVAAILNRLFRYCDGCGGAGRAFMDEYRALSCVLGKEVTYARGGESGTGVATGIDDRGRLLVEKSGSGGTLALDSGEIGVSVKVNS